MHTVRALLLAIALAATACSSDSDTAIEAEAESPTTTARATTTEAPSAPATDPVAEPVAETVETESVAEPAEAEPAGAESGDGTITIEFELDMAAEETVGTFVVADGAQLLGCSSGLVEIEGGIPRTTTAFMSLFCWMCGWFA